VTGLNTGRGTPKWSEQLPAVEKPSSPLDAQLGVLEKNLRSPYTERWSFGFQRQLSNRIVIDGSYVGSQSHKLTTRDEANPLVNRLDPTGRSSAIGGRNITPAEFLLPRDTVASGSPLPADFVTGSYTWSRNIDSTSDGVGSRRRQSSVGNRTSIDIWQGRVETRSGPSDSIVPPAHDSLRVDLPGPAGGFLKYPLGRLVVTGITSFQSGLRSRF
jgi:hypothetical protein